MSGISINLDYEGSVNAKIGDFFYIDGIDNDTITTELLQFQNNRLSTNPKSCEFEDFELPDTESVKHLLFKIDTIIKNNYKSLKFSEAWSHILHPQQSTMYHSHKGPMDGLSFVYYVAYPEYSGDLVFDFEILGKRVYIDNTPKVGGLILFPTWVPHYTTRNISDGTRISISGNYFPI